MLVCWIAHVQGAADEYQTGVVSEKAKMMRASLQNRRAVIQNRSTGEPVSDDFMQDVFLPKLATLKIPRKNIEQIAKAMDLGKLYDVLYRSMSLDLHGNSFGLPEYSGEGADFAALSALETLLDCMILILAVPRRSFNAMEILVRMKLERPGPSP